jgi:hypothetical protein
MIETLVPLYGTGTSLAWLALVGHHGAQPGCILLFGHLRRQNAEFPMAGGHPGRAGIRGRRRRQATHLRGRAGTCCHRTEPSVETGHNKSYTGWAKWTSYLYGIVDIYSRCETGVATDQRKWLYAWSGGAEPFTRQS